MNDAPKLAYRSTEVGGHGFVGAKAYNDFIKEHPGRYAFIHNHPDGDSLSQQDVATLLSKNIEMMIGSGNNGKVYIGIIKGKQDIVFRNEYVKIENEVKKKHRDKYELYRQGDLPYFDYHRLIEKETVKAIVEKYGVFYEMET